MPSDSPSYLKAMTSLLQEAPDPQEAARRRHDFAARIQSASQETKRRVAVRRRRARWAGWLSAAAALTLFSWGLGRVSFESEGSRPVAQTLDEQPSAGPASSATPLIRVEQGTLLGPAQASWGPGDGVGSGLISVGGTETARVRLNSGALVRAATGSQVQWRTEDGRSARWESLVLAHGSVALDVPPLKKNQRLTVRTTEALVEVRGTAFEVVRSDSQGEAVTKVRVSEGLVAVRSRGVEFLLAAGDEWTSRCPSKKSPCAQGTTLDEAEVTPKAAMLNQSEPESNAAEPALSDQAKDSAVAPKSSALAEQNRLYQNALRAHHSGRDDLARSRFLLLLERYPSSPLAVGARRELHRLDGSAPQP